MRPSSILRIQILRQRRFKRDRVLAEYEKFVVESLSKGTCIVIRNLFLLHTSDIFETGSASQTVEMVPIDPKTDTIKLSFHLVMNDNAPTSFDELGIDAATSSLAKSRVALARREPGRFASMAFDTVQTAVSVGNHAQSLEEGARKLDSEQIIGVLVALLDGVVKVGDELATVGLSHGQ